MKTLNICAALLFSIFAINFSFAQTTVKKETIRVWGNCGMCKKTIEKAAKKAGAITANWNVDSKLLNVSYAVNKTSSAKIQETIAKSGYDTRDFTADNSAYDHLDACCKYDRKEANVSEVNPATETAAITYTCPMHPDVTSDKPGKCSKCGMDLVKKTKKEPLKVDGLSTYSCPMHPEVTSNKPGKCPKCGMDLKEKQ